MKFYGNGVVWDGANNRPLCKFINGVLETDDEGICEKLTSRGYPHDTVVKSFAVINEQPPEIESIAVMGEKLPEIEVAKPYPHASNLPRKVVRK